MDRHAFFAALLIGWTYLSNTVLAQLPFPAEELVENGSFETLSVNDQEEPTVDVFGNTQPAGWFRNLGHPDTHPGPLSKLVSPTNGDDPDDSAPHGTGTNSAAFFRNPEDFDQHTDWRSHAFETTPGEALWWSFDFKVENYSYDPTNNPTGQPEGFRASMRSFDSESDNGGTAGNHAGALSLFVYIHGYGDDVDGDGVGDSGGIVMAQSGYPHAEQDVHVTGAPFEIGTWYTLNSAIFGGLRTIPSVADGAPFEGNYTDWRFVVGGPRDETNWLQMDTEDFQLRIDNVSTLRGVDAIAGDFNGDGTVDAADFLAWRDGLGGEFDSDDYSTWRQNFGKLATELATTSRAVAAVPEPAAWATCCMAWVLIGGVCRNFCLQRGSYMRA